MKFSTVFLATTLIASSSSFAADPIVYEEPTPTRTQFTTPAKAAAFSWSGSYFGGQVGYGWGNSDFNHNKGSIKTDPDGFIGGIYAGYNATLSNNLVIGTDADLSYSTLKGDHYHKSDLGERKAAQSKLLWSGAVRARAGLAFDRTLPYIAGGLAFGNVENVAKYAGQHSKTSSTQSETLTGWTIGGGADYAATDKLILRMEYRYTDFGNKSYKLNYNGNPAEYKNKFKTHDVRLGVAYKFN